MKRRSPSIQKFLSYTLLCTALTLGFEARIIAQSEKTKQQGSSASTQATSTSVWSWETAAKIKLTQSNVAPKIETFVNLAPEANIWVWDSWVLRNRDGSLAQVDGYYILFSLVAPRVLAPEERHNQARIGYWYSKNGRDWTFAGEAFPQEEGLGSRQWSGGALYDKGELYLFYTAVGRKREPKVGMEQRLALAKAKIVSNPEGVGFIDWTPHQVILEPEGVYYQTELQSDWTPEGIRPPSPGPEGNDTPDGGNRIIYSFRDPWLFEDPVDGKTYLLFATNTSGTYQNKRCSRQNIGNVPFSSLNIPRATVEFNGSVGIAVAPDPDNLFVWKRLPSFFNAKCVNQQLELPRFVFKDGKYYLFFASHKFTFPPGLRDKGLDALYGFVSDSLYGEYRPLNESGLVLANPPDNPIQTFAWVVMPNGIVLSFINYTNLGDVNPDKLHEQPIQFQRDRFGGTLAPTIQLEISGDRTRVVRQLGQGAISATN